MGAGLFAFLFNLIIHIPTRLPAFKWYLAYQIFNLTNFVANTGLGHRFIWQGSTYLTDSAHVLLSAFAFSFAIQFNRVFLRTEILMLRADRLLKLMLGMAIIGGLSYLTGFRGIATNMLMLTALSLAIMPFFGLWAWKVLERTDARWYVLAWSVWSVAIVLLVGNLSGILEVSNTTLWFVRMGFLLENVLLGLALIDQINVLREEKVEAERRLIDSLESSNIVLEQRVQQRTEELEKARHVAEEMAETDPLTGIGNRYFFFSCGEELFRLAKRHGHTWSMVMLDIDHFKKVNDTWGTQSVTWLSGGVAELSQ